MNVIRKADIGDAIFFTENMREEDRIENKKIREFTGSDSSEYDSLLSGIQNGECFVGEHNGVPVFIYGAVPQSDNYSAIGWNICTPGISECKLFVYETAHEYNNDLKKRFGLIMNLIHKKNKIAWRLAQKLGAKFELIKDDVYLFHIEGER